MQFIIRQLIIHLPAAGIWSIHINYQCMLRHCRLRIFFAMYAEYVVSTSD